ncbi:MAG TPA: hypothetical protein VF077_07590 [Nitrospiraceae bacterium]
MSWPRQALIDLLGIGIQSFRRQWQVHPRPRLPHDIAWRARGIESPALSNRRPATAA